MNSEMVGVMPLGDAARPASRTGDRTRAGWRETVRERDVHRVVDRGRHRVGAPAELEAIQAAKALGVKVSVLPRVLEVVGSAASFDYVDGLTLLGVPRFGLSPPRGGGQALPRPRRCGRGAARAPRR